jgi:hypothetical protein
VRLPPPGRCRRARACQPGECLFSLPRSARHISPVRHDYCRQLPMGWTAARTLPPFGRATRTTAILVRGAHNRALGYLRCPSGSWLSAPRSSIMRTSVPESVAVQTPASRHSTRWLSLAGDRKRPQDLGLGRIPEGARSSSPGSLESNPWRRLTISEHREHLLLDTEDVPCRGAAVVGPNAGMRQRICRRARSARAPAGQVWLPPSALAATRTAWQLPAATRRNPPVGRRRTLSRIRSAGPSSSLGAHRPGAQIWSIWRAAGTGAGCAGAHPAE